MKVVLALGSNVGRRFDTLQGAVDALFDAPGLEFTSVSPVYETEPVGGPPNQRPYLNAVVVGRTMTLGPHAILERALGVEAAFGRVRIEDWGPRTLDVDVIMVGDLLSEDPELTLPHPLAHTRAFVLVPWSQIDPGAVLPGRGSVAGLLADIDQRGVRLRADLALQPPG
ncbi:2-amino-4-hydroxy-6-hydroxymethyldihydropteridine diphosphokinase [Sphaerisporangium sp. TRM90804]|uniref:2-amino-4-hydroxy-6- hydroxymethyldihydropteridine diphosphokinase n=1 Tax=Sphaerisporangium sp. TRM90804 TaxID=3031113 RepID=UPI00244C7699|nr:2-amino-4-hydroxy-6-hydroxymethyldihydropteridine diphosphokinase [Sphaerisporangium sp. TRM90804]MDH2425862.1 2-amino-4-hydroxy-6-hydroxymethyldihydropteridine diphosphokinase [Sphaerisporangium sp. TRM90804]